MGDCFIGRIIIWFNEKIDITLEINGQLVGRRGVIQTLISNVYLLLLQVGLSINLN
jgi:hypothetical protein